MASIRQRRFVYNAAAGARGWKSGNTFVCFYCKQSFPEAVRSDHERACSSPPVKGPRAKVFSGGLPGGKKRKTAWTE